VGVQRGAREEAGGVVVVLLGWGGWGCGACTIVSLGIAVGALCVDLGALPLLQLVNAGLFWGLQAVEGGCGAEWHIWLVAWGLAIFLGRWRSQLQDVSTNPHTMRLRCAFVVATEEQLSYCYAQPIEPHLPNKASAPY